MARGKKTGGRRMGSKNKRRRDIETYCRSIVEDATYRAQLQARALAGTLPPPLEVLLFHYAYGKPSEPLDVGTLPAKITITF